ncbi:hypothetical protein TSAR_016270 [Trichomalopsis sarcophagae]|uniref:HAT C-terminal dimerisation domain-containing protein n=1 Tax=Trichomalopsis sarcophagae TaxID=543379 RepID=A0A232F5K9_9HYME|nr:hypothetical protein TSAR_016270 [Trichomalopsis sarcophagae]
MANDFLRFNGWADDILPFEPTENMLQMVINKVYNRNNANDDENELDVDHVGIVRYLSLSKFALNVLTVPHCNAEPERAWSEERLIKTRLRNRLTLPNLCALMMANDFLRFNGWADDILPFEPTENMLQMVINKVYNRNNANDDEDDDDENKLDVDHVGIVRYLLQ